jgi:plasmid maintenance system antidote protein VapI
MAVLTCFPENVTPAMGLRLERVLGIRLPTWLNIQAAVDIYDAA